MRGEERWNVDVLSWGGRWLASLGRLMAVGGQIYNSSLIARTVVICVGVGVIGR